MGLVDGAGTPLGLHVAAASPAEVTLLDATLATVRVARAHRAGRPRCRPDRLIADRGYDSHAVRTALDTRGIQPIIPARSNNHRATHQDGRCLRRYRRRWVVERSNAWLYNFRRLVVRYERSVEIYTALVHLACALITLKRVFGGLLEARAFVPEPIMRLLSSVRIGHVPLRAKPARITASRNVSQPVLDVPDSPLVSDCLKA